MRKLTLTVVAAIGTWMLIRTPLSQAQAPATPTATEQLSISAFGGATGTYTGLLGGRNLGITAGADLEFMTFRRYRPILEIRGTYPVHGGQIDAQRNLLGGIAVERQFGRLHPYVDFLVGRGELKYQNRGLQVGNIDFLSSTSTVLSPGLGINVDVSPQWSAKADFQYQHWDVPFGVASGVPQPTTFNGTIYSKVLTVGAVYRFDFNHHYHPPRHQR